VTEVPSDSEATPNEGRRFIARWLASSLRVGGTQATCRLAANVAGKEVRARRSLRLQQPAAAEGSSSRVDGGMSIIERSAVIESLRGGLAPHADASGAYRTCPAGRIASGAFFNQASPRDRPLELPGLATLPLHSKRCSGGHLPDDGVICESAVGLDR